MKICKLYFKTLILLLAKWQGPFFFALLGKLGLWPHTWNFNLLGKTENRRTEHQRCSTNRFCAMKISGCSGTIIMTSWVKWEAKVRRLLMWDPTLPDPTLQDHWFVWLNKDKNKIFWSFGILKSLFGQGLYFTKVYSIIYIL